MYRHTNKIIPFLMLLVLQIRIVRVKCLLNISYVSIFVRVYKVFHGNLIHTES